MSVKPNFRRGVDGQLLLKNSVDGHKIKARNSKNTEFYRCMSARDVRRLAVAAVERRGGSSGDEMSVLSEHTLQFGSYRGQTFLWLVENCMGYAAWFVDSMKGENCNDTPLGINKFLLKKFLLSFPELQEAMDLRKKLAARPSTQSQLKPVASLVNAGHLTPAMVASRMKAAMSGKQFIPNVARSRQSATCQREVSDEELCAEVAKAEQLLVSSVASDLKKPSGPVSSSSSSASATVTSAELQNDDSGIQTTQVALKTLPKQPAVHIRAPSQDYPLPEGWRSTLPKADHAWVSRALFRYSASGKVQLDDSKVDRLWYNPAQPSPSCNQPPRVDRYFASRLLLWMPRRLWGCQLHCPQQSCTEKELTACGIYPRVRQVLTVNGFYSLAAEYLECRCCKRKVISWSSGILRQLDVGHRQLFPAILTYQYACDTDVVCFLRQRGLGNSASRLQRTLCEQHGEAWLKKVNHYLTDCETFLRKQTLVVSPNFPEPPVQVPVPSAHWLQAVYVQDVLQRLDEVKAAITSTFGRILKLDSTKKIARKLAGYAAGTAAWATDVGNEYGQVMMCVLTAGEGCGLDKMLAGLVQRYQLAPEVPPPVLLYVDRDCCTTKQCHALASWPDLQVRLDIWHFMRRIASGCTTDAHPLYKSFMGRLSQCIFEWDKEDLDRLVESKRREMMDAHIPYPSYGHVMRNISRMELARHCRRSTRGVEATTALLSSLLDIYSQDAGRDTLGVPLFDKDRMVDIWESQKRHVNCIQDPAGIQLYIETGSQVKGGIALPVYRCARGSTSLESFHRHLKDFIPGTTASDVHFQAYLLEGIVRWNEDRYKDAMKSESTRSEPHTYSGLLRHATNRLSQRVFGKAVYSNFVQPRKYTGELIGVEYLYEQTGRSLQNVQELPEAEAEGSVLPDGVDNDMEIIDQNILELVDNTIFVLDDMPCTAATTSTQPASSPAATTSTRTCTQRPVPSCTYTPSSAPPLPAARFLGPQPQDASLPSSASPPVHWQLPCEVKGGAVGPDNVPGYEKVEALAQFLVSLHDQGGPLNNEQADKIVHLWNNLVAYDKAPTVFPERFRSGRGCGRFKAPKKRQQSEGVLSSKRCFLGENAGPAQWPDCNRYVECIVLKLCSLFPSHKRVKNGRILRWTLISSAYKRIRELILSNPRVMQDTALQIVEINNTTLTQWHSRHAKKQEQAVLDQGVASHLPINTCKPITTCKPVPPALPPMPVIIIPAGVSQEVLHSFQMPPNTAGLATTTHKPITIVPAGTQEPRRLLPAPPGPSLQSNPPYHLQQKSVPASTLWYRKRRAEEEKKLGVPLKRNKRHVEIFRCKQCGMDRKPECHKQYYGHWFCQASATLPYETWLQDLKSRGVGIRKKKEKQEDGAKHL